MGKVCVMILSKAESIQFHKNAKKKSGINCLVSEKCEIKNVLCSKDYEKSAG